MPFYPRSLYQQKCYSGNIFVTVELWLQYTCTSLWCRKELTWSRLLKCDFCHRIWITPEFLTSQSTQTQKFKRQTKRYRYMKYHRLQILVVASESLSIDSLICLFAPADIFSLPFRSSMFKNFPQISNDVLPKSFISVIHCGFCFFSALDLYAVVEASFFFHFHFLDLPFASTLFWYLVQSM